MTNSGRELLLKAITEKQWQAQVEAWARRGGWLTYHTVFSHFSGLGFPDLCMVRGDRLVFAELKRESGKTTDRQEAWLTALRACGRAEVYVWRPTDEDQVRAVLLGGRG